MKKNISNKYLVICIPFMLFGLGFGSIGMANTNAGYTNITPNEAKDMLNSLSDGLQIPIDVRTESEWYNERISTPYPQDPKHYCLTNLQNENGLQEFISLYNGSEIIVYCKSGGRSSSAAHILDNSNFNGTIYNMQGGITAWKTAGYPTKTGNQAPNQPEKPSGSTICNINMPYTFYSSTIDSDDDSIKYGWDWNGDNNIDEWTTYFQSGTKIYVSHTWTSVGTYNVTIIAEDNVGDQSDFSEPLTITINTQPESPTILGPTSGKAGEECEYVIVATDPDGDNVTYCIDWGDNTGEVCIGPFTSGEEVTVTHTWAEKGTYIIKIKTRDINDAESDWTTLDVNMPKNKQTSSFPFLRFLVRFIEQFPLLKQFLQL